MSITVNNSGSLHELSDISANIGGVLRSLDRITVNEGGTLREIFAKAASGGLPTSLTWSVDTSINGRDTGSKISSVSDDGMKIVYVSNTVEKAACIRSNTFHLPSGAAASVTPTSISGNGTSADTIWAYLYDADDNLLAGETTHNNSNGMRTLTLTAPTEGEYHIRLGGYSLTGGQTMSYYTSTVSAVISFSI